ncbi:unnamed protein product [Sphagnum tenellum]
MDKLMMSRTFFKRSKLSVVIAVFLLHFQLSQAISIEDLSSGAFNFDSLSNQLTSLEFSFLEHHLESLHRTRRVRRYLAIKARRERRHEREVRRNEQRMLARGGKLKEKVKDIQLAEANPPESLENLGQKLVGSYPGLYRDHVKISRAHSVNYKQNLRDAHSNELKVKKVEAKKFEPKLPPFTEHKPDSPQSREVALASPPSNGLSDQPARLGSNSDTDHLQTEASDQPDQTDPVKHGHQVYRVFHEAFDPQTPVVDGLSDYLSHESPTSGWSVSTAYQHLPTLEWVSDSTQSRETPLLSDNTARLLSSLAGVVQQNDRGWVFGKLAPGWKIEFSGGAELPIYLDEQLRVVSSEDVHSERYFAFLNAEPGSHLVYLTQTTESGAIEGGGVALPVLVGTATYLNLTSISYARFSGHVAYVPDEIRDAMPIAGAVVRLLGQPDVAGNTDENGHFRFNHVTVVGDYPLYAETDQGSGFTHRYRILPKNLRNITLFRIRKFEVKDWFEQHQEQTLGAISGGMPGAIDENSGMILASVAGIVEHHKQSEEGHDILVPSIRPLIANSTTIPSTYTVTPADALLADASLEIGESRFLGINVPEGPTLAQVSQIQRDGKKVTWSELTFVSPHVITLLGPY